MTRETEFDQSLEGMRGLSAFTVVVGHAAASVIPAEHLAWTMMFHWLSRAAVLFFFVLSGYVITLSIVQAHRTGAFSLRRFVINRIARIYPPFLLALAVVWLVAVLSTLGWLGSTKGFPLGAFAITPVNLLRDGLFLFGMGTPMQMINGPVWSLRIEVICYAVAALFATGLFRRRLVGVLSVLVALVLVLMALRRLEGAAQGFLAFSLGALAVLRPVVFRPIPPLAAVTAVVLAMVGAHWLTGASRGIYAPSHWSYLAFEITVIICFATLVAQRGNDATPIQAAMARLHLMAKGSYTLFITHVPIMILVTASLPAATGGMERFGMALLLILCAVAVAIPASMIVERQHIIRRWLDGVLPRA